MDLQGLQLMIILYIHSKFCNVLAWLHYYAKKYDKQKPQAQVNTGVLCMATLRTMTKSDISL
jgi:hypothetical protein